MQKKTCTKCGFEKPLNDIFNVDGAHLCETCGNLKLAELQASKIKPAVFRMSDPTVCNECKMDNGNSELGKVAGLPYCPACTEPLYSRQFPTWLQYSMAGMLILLAFALIHSIPYFKAEHELLLGEKLLESGKAQEASEHLKAAVDIGSQSDNVLLLATKSYLLAGDPDSADKIAKLKSEYEVGQQLAEINKIWTRVNQSFKKSEEASMAYKEGKSKEAYQLMKEASILYPEYSVYKQNLIAYELTEAFKEKDYPKYLALAEQEWKKDPNDYENNSLMAAALSDMYAKTGSLEFKNKAESAFAKARELSIHSEESKKDFIEFAERYEYRMKTRIILSREEFDQKFHPEKLKKGK